jgi:hypothetical protein
VKRKKDLYFLLGTTLILVIFWVVFSIYQNLISSTISTPVAVDINPIQPTFNEATLDALKKRQKISPLYTSVQQPSSPEPQSSTSSGQTQKATSSAQKSP